MSKTGFRWLKHDLTGQRFGKLIVDGYNPRYRRGKNPAGNEVWFGEWLCRCDCGQHVYKKGKDLQAGFAKSCGCAQHAPDMTGQRFGMIEVIRRDRTKVQRTNAMWLVRCDCGQERIVSGSVLRRGQQKSCGCRKQEAMQNSPNRLKNRKKGIDEKRRKLFATKQFEISLHGVVPRFTVQEFLNVKSLATEPLNWRCVAHGHEFSRAWYSSVNYKSCPICVKQGKKKKDQVIDPLLTILPTGNSTIGV